MVKTLNFSIGENFGKLLCSVAAEKVLYDYDVESGMKTIQNSLIGISEDLAYLVMIGTLKLIVDIKVQFRMKYFKL